MVIKRRDFPLWGSVLKKEKSKQIINNKVKKDRRRKKNGKERKREKRKKVRQKVRNKLRYRTEIYSLRSQSEIERD